MAPKGNAYLLILHDAYCLWRDGRLVAQGEGPEGIRVEGRAKDLLVFCHLERVWTFFLPIPVKDGKDRVIEGILLREMEKRNLGLGDRIFCYQVVERGDLRGIRAYLFDPEEIRERLTPLLEAKGTALRGCYPLFSLLSPLLREGQGEGSMVLIPRGRRRTVFVFQGQEMVYQRTYEGRTERVGPEDAVPLGMVLSHAVQNLRVRPEVLLLMGEGEGLEGLGIPVKVLPSWEELGRLSDPRAVPGSLAIREPGCQALTAQAKVFGALGRACWGLSVLFAALSVYLALTGKARWEDGKALLEAQTARWAQAAEELEAVRSFWEGYGPWLALWEEKAKAFDPLEILGRLGFLADLEDIRLKELSLGAKGEVRLRGMILREGYSGRQGLFVRLKEALASRGFTVKGEKWELLKGDFEVEVVYGPEGHL